MSMESLIEKNSKLIFKKKLESLLIIFKLGFRIYVTFQPADPNLWDTDPPENALKFKMSKHSRI